MARPCWTLVATLLGCQPPALEQSEVDCVESVGGDVDHVCSLMPAAHEIRLAGLEHDGVKERAVVDELQQLLDDLTRPDAGARPQVLLQRELGGGIAAAGVLVRDVGGLTRGTRVIAVVPTRLLEHLQASDTGIGTLRFLLAHQLGHHVRGHLHGPERREIAMELEADEYAGYLLGRAEHPEDEATAWARANAPLEGAVDLPPRRARVEAASRGWRRGRAERAR